MKIAIEIPDDLYSMATAVAEATDRPLDELVVDGIRLIVERQVRSPTIPICISEDPHFAERVDEWLARTWADDLKER